MALVQMVLFAAPPASALRYCQRAVLRFSRHALCAVAAKELSSLQLVAATPTATQLLAHYFAASLQQGDCYLLYGDVGAGKSHFSRAFIQAALKDDTLPVPSPTFLLQNIYETGRDSSPIHHYDLYRLTQPDDLARLDLAASLPTATSLIEWAERLGTLTPPHHLAIKIRIMKAQEQEALTAARAPECGTSNNNLGEATGSSLGENESENGEEDISDIDYDSRWRHIELVSHGNRWEERVGALQQHIGARGAEFGLFLA